MLIKPSSCYGCPLHQLGEGFMQPELAEDGYGVALIAEALGETERDIGGPFKGKAGHKLNRLLEWAGLDRARFDIYNTVWCRPPDNLLEGQPYEYGATQHCQTHHWGRLVSRASVIVPLGNVATGAILGSKGILSKRGYVFSSEKWPGVHILPTVHPSFILRGNSRYAAAFIHDVQKAVELARDGMQFEAKDFTIDPTPGVAYEWAQRYRAVLGEDPTTLLSYDIETPHKGSDEEDLGEFEGEDESYFIWRIGFSYAPNTALSIPWTPAYIPAIKLLLESSGEKVVWNAGFDNPRIRHNGVNINGTIHDGMVAWHILHSDLPKGLAFVATFTCPFQPPWKHLSKASPGFYNATDADVELKSFLMIQENLKNVGLWSVYQRDVLDLEPILIHMNQEGMPIDGEVRLDRAIKLSNKLADIKSSLEPLIPSEARVVAHIYKTEPKDLTGLLDRPVIRTIPVCDRCGIAKPKKDHFKVFKRKQNPCGGANITEADTLGTEYYRLRPFTPSRDQLLRYQQVLCRPVPTVYDKKTKKHKPSMGAKQLRKLSIKYPDDQVYKLVMEYREVEKIAGTYIGKVDET